MIRTLIPLVLFGALFVEGSTAPECACHGCWSQSLVQITCPAGGNPPLIVPSFQKAVDNKCKVTEQGCGVAEDPKKCTATAKVRVAFPANSCRASVWIMGGDAYPVPTQVNATTQDSTLTVEAGCGSSGTTVFKVWYSQPSDGEQVADASYTFALRCDSCSNTDPC